MGWRPEAAIDTRERALAKPWQQKQIDAAIANGAGDAQHRLPQFFFVVDILQHIALVDNTHQMLGPGNPPENLADTSPEFPFTFDPQKIKFTNIGRRALIIHAVETSEWNECHSKVSIIPLMT